MKPQDRTPVGWDRIEAGDPVAFDGPMLSCNVPQRREDRAPAEALKMVCGYVYVLQAQHNGYVKVGFSKRPAARVMEIATNAGCFVRIVALRVATMYDEQAIHRALNGWSMHGEWFFPTGEFHRLFEADGWMLGQDAHDHLFGGGQP